MGITDTENDFITMPATGWREHIIQTEGHKDDSGKSRLDLIAPEMMFALGSVLGFGAIKYAPHNWAKGMAWSRPFGAMMRHMWAWWGGKQKTNFNFLLGNLDTETTFSHLWHAACCLMFLIAYEARGSGTDDRYNG
jgi:hypothetical protein